MPRAPSGARRLFVATTLFVITPAPFAPLGHSAQRPGEQGGSALAQEVDAEPPSEPEGPPAPPQVIVVGQVTDAVGAGLTGVSVTAFRKNPDGSRGPKIGEAATDAMGDFTVTSAEPVTGEIVVVLSKDQYADLSRTLRAGESTRPPFLGETLQGNLILVGRVLNAATQAPIGGAKVSFQTIAFERTAESDAKGSFSVVGLSPGDGELHVSAAKFGRERVSVQVPAAEPILILLKPERIVHLTIVDDLDRPVRGATVECADAPRGDFRTVVSGDDGTVDLSGLHFDASGLVVRLSRDGHVATEGPGERLTLPLLEAESHHRLVLPRAGTIAGRVVGGPDDEPLHGARVMSGDVLSDDAPRTWTDVHGKFLLEGVRPGSVAVTVFLAGWAPELQTVDVLADESARLDLTLMPPASLRGTVKSQEGDPIAGAEVAAARWRDRTTLGLRTQTGHEGTFVLENAPHDEFEITVRAQGASPYSAKVRGDAPEPLEIVLRAGASSDTADAAMFLKAGDAVPTVTVRTLDGASISLDELRGKSTLVVFWATWCGPCLAEVPTLTAVYEKYRGQKDFAMIGISRDFGEADLRNYLRQNPRVAWPQVYGEEGGVPQAAEAFGVWGIPAIFLIGPDGKLAASGLRGEETDAAVGGLLKGGKHE